MSATPKARRPLREPLRPAGAQLLSRVPAEAVPRHTAAHFPHVINRLGALWSQPREFDAAIDALLLDDRPDRQGFPMFAIIELTNLRAWYAETVAPRLADAPAAATRTRRATRRATAGRRD